MKGVLYNISPFTPKFLQINSPPDLFLYFFVMFTGIRCGHRIFFVTPMRSSGSRVDIAQKPNKSGQILDQRWKIFCNFYEINSSQDFFCIAKILVLMVWGYWLRFFAQSDACCCVWGESAWCCGGGYFRRVGAWKCLGSLPPDPKPNTG